jgi:hypothetical protein
MNNFQKITLAIVIATGLGYAFGRYAQPAKVQIQEKEVNKQVAIVDHNTVTETHQVKQPDGTIVTDTTTKDLDVDKTSSIDTKQEKETISNTKPQWKVQGLVGLSSVGLTQPLYGAGVERRILGPVSAGVWGLTGGNNGVTGGLSLSVEF